MQYVSNVVLSSCNLYIAGVDMVLNIANIETMAISSTSIIAKGGQFVNIGTAGANEDKTSLLGE